MIMVTIQLNLEPLGTTYDFPYLVHTITFNKSYWADWYCNFRKVQRRWGLVAKVLVKSRAMVLEQVMVYKAVLYMVLLYRSNSRVVTDIMLKVQ